MSSVDINELLNAQVPSRNEHLPPGSPSLKRNLDLENDDGDASGGSPGHEGYNHLQTYVLPRNDLSRQKRSVRDSSAPLSGRLRSRKSSSARAPRRGGRKDSDTTSWTEEPPIETTEGVDSGTSIDPWDMRKDSTASDVSFASTVSTRRHSWESDASPAITLHALAQSPHRFPPANSGITPSLSRKMASLRTSHTPSPTHSPIPTRLTTRSRLTQMVDISNDDGDISINNNNIPIDDQLDLTNLSTPELLRRSVREEGNRDERLAASLDSHPSHWLTMQGQIAAKENTELHGINRALTTKLSRATRTISAVQRSKQQLDAKCTHHRKTQVILNHQLKSLMQENAELKIKLGEEKFNEIVSGVRVGVGGDGDAAMDE